jgi:hypothetical protein
MDPIKQHPKPGKYFSGFISPVETDLNIKPSHIYRKGSFEQIMKNHPTLNNIVYNNTIHQPSSHISTHNHPFSRTNPFQNDLF